MSVIREEMMLGGLGASDREACGARKPASSGFAAIAFVGKCVVRVLLVHFEVT